MRKWGIEERNRFFQEMAPQSWYYPGTVTIG